MNTKTDLEILKDARALITSRKNWTTGTFALDENRVDASTRIGEGVCFCAIGAVARALHDDRRLSHGLDTERLHDLWNDLSEAVAEVNPRWPLAISSLNDRTDYGHGPVLQVFDTLISKLEARS